MVLINDSILLNGSFRYLLRSAPIVLNFSRWLSLKNCLMLTCTLIHSCLCLIYSIYRSRVFLIFLNKLVGQKVNAARSEDLSIKIEMF